MTNIPSPTLLEEFLLLALNDRTGQFHPVEKSSLHRAAASAVLMELAFRNRIDYDLRDMFTVDPTPTGDDILDPVVRLISQAPVLTPHSTIYWLGKLSDEGEDIVKRGLDRLEKRGYIRCPPSMGIFWMFGLAAQPNVDTARVNESKAALLTALSGDKIPTSRTVFLTGLIDSCGLFSYILSDNEKQAVSARIAEFARMDLVAQATKSISNGDAIAVAAGG
jgi:Golgi phosphoprotein 3